MTKLWVFDLVAALVLSVTALAGAYLPVILARRGRATGERSLSFVLGNMLSAGVMISAGFCHLLGDAIQTLTQTVEFPLAPFLCACGFLSTLLADQVVEGITLKPPSHFDSESGEGDETRLTSIAVHGENSSSRSSSHSHGHCFGAAVHHIAGSTARSAPASPGGRTSPLTHPEEPSSLGSSPCHRNGTHTLESDDDVDDGRGRLTSSSGLSNQKVARFYGEPTDADDESRGGSSSRSRRGGGRRRALEVDKPARSQVSFLTAVLMGVALTFHSLLEGAALGAQQSVDNSWHIFIAIQAHKGLAAYALGSSIVDSDADTRQFWSVICMFAFATPVGIALGFILSSVAASSGAAAVSALASGTFLYVAFMEVLPRELLSSSHRLPKMAMLLLGFGLMSLLAIWA